MARYIFPSFHYHRDIWRASQVRNSWVTQDRKIAGFWDGAAWENVKRRGKAAIEAWIEEQLRGTAVTVVLIGAETASRPFVIHEIKRSCALGKGVLGVRIHQLRNQQGFPDVAGANPFDSLWYDRSWGRQNLSQIYRTYDYVADSGYANFNAWIEEAARAAGK